METNKKNIPEIRFPEFMNDGEWLSASLYELIETITPTNKLQTSEYKPSGKYPIIDQSQKYIVAYSDSAEALTNTGCSDTIVFGDHTCALKFVSFPFIQGADGIKIFKSKDNNKIVTDYLYQYLSAFPIESKEYKRHFSELKETLIKFPSDAIEQKRIAECMESLERYTIQTKVKLEQLKAHKKGLMQKLFPAPGKSAPECRFKEFENAGEWKTFKLKDIASFFKGKGISKTDVSDKAMTPCIRYGELYTTYNEVIETTKSYTNLPLSDLFLSKSNDIIIPSSGETAEDIATASCILKDGIALSGDINIIRTAHNGVFLAYYLTHVKNNDIARKAQGVSIIHLYNEQLQALSIELPNYEEQKRIADCLSSIDYTIRLYSNKLDILERHKQALRQRLFPTI